MRIRPDVVFLLSAVLLSLAALFSVGYMHPDEHFQILEFAGYKLGMTTESDLAWEYSYKMRPALQPGITVVLYRVCCYIGIISPFTIATILRFLSAGITFLSMWLMYKAYSKEITNEKLRKWFLLLSFFIWFAIFHGVRFSSENWSGNIFIIAFALYYLKKDKWGTYIYVLSGILMGLSFIIRYQSGILIAGFILWNIFIRKERFVNILVLIMGLVLAFSTGLIIDRWYYGEWTITALNYFSQNILEDKVSGFGVLPWWFYFYAVFVETIPPFSLIWIAAFILFFIFLKKDPVTWITLPFLFVHFLIGHKETRFLIPLIGFIPVVTIKMFELVTRKWDNNLLERKAVRYIVPAFWIINLLFLIIVIIRPADERINLFKKLYDDYPKPVTLYYDGEDPFRKAREIFFYRRWAIRTKAVKNWEDINKDTSAYCLFATKTNGNISVIRKNSSLIYSSYPQFIRKMNFNHWVERTHFWNIYELRRIDSLPPGNKGQ